MHRLEQHPDYTNWFVKPENTHQMLRRRYDEFMAKPKEERPDFVIPTLGTYCLQPGDWTIGTHHHAQWPYLITKVWIHGDEHWEYWSWLRGYVPKPGVMVHCFQAVRLDDYLKYNCRITEHDDQKSWFSGYVPQDDHMTEIVNGPEGLIKIWKISEPEAVMKAKGGQMTIF